MDEHEIDIARWLAANGIAGDPNAAAALAAALSRPGHYGALVVERQGEETRVIGPAGELTLEGGLGIQALRMRLDEIVTHPGQSTV